MTKGEIAKKYFKDGYNCAQSVLLAFCEDLGFDKKTALMISQPFGGGMGRLREVCGTVSAMYMVLGLVRGNDNPNDRQAKADIYQAVQTLAERFRADNGSIICRDLLDLRKKGKDSPIPSQRTQEYYKVRPCAELCKYAADLLAEYLEIK